MKHRRGVVWLRRDLRLDDHVALGAAAKECEEIALAFVLDPPLLRGERTSDAIVAFFFDALAELRDDLRANESDLALLEGDFAGELLAFARRIGADALYFNRDYEPHAIARDEAVGKAFAEAGIAVASFVDHVGFAADAIVQDGGKPYVVFSPYRRRWRERYHAAPCEPIASRRAALAKGKLLTRRTIGATRDVPEPTSYGRERSAAYPVGGEERAKKLLTEFLARDAGAYKDARDFPARDGTSHLSPHLRAGTIGVRTCLARAFAASAHARGALGIETWIDELIWRDFYQQVLARFPHVAEHPFLEAAEKIPWRTAPHDFTAWCEGRTGYPIVDAAMLQLNTTGWMHNRLRMIVASFLTKHLLIDWRLGERYFMQRLADGDLAQNNGGWQWSASTGTDAAPYFRVFNPILQGRKFDPDGAFVRSMIPALADVPTKFVHEPWTLPPLVARAAKLELGETYPHPIVDHKEARERVLAAFAPVLGRKPAPATGANVKS